jgi:hypothetical protein
MEDAGGMSNQKVLEFPECLLWGQVRQIVSIARCQLFLR